MLQTPASISASEDSSMEFKVWYRHAGEAMIYAIPNELKMKPIKDYNQITSRSIGFNCITHMCIELGEKMAPLDLMCPVVTHLKISNICKDQDLTCLTKLRELHTLDISGNDFSTGLPSSVSEIKSLQELDLTGCNLTDLPESLSNLEKLNILYISENDFSGGLPSVICQLKNLQRLYALRCKLPELPPRLANLKVLQTLDVAHNPFISGFPSVICELKTLERLYIRDCNLTDLPESFSSLTNMDVLNLAYNYFTILPPVVYRMFNLKKLYLWSNKELNKIDKDLLNLPELHTIICDECDSLLSPPYAVCRQGISAIKKYFADHPAAARVEVIAESTVDVFQSAAGKPQTTGFKVWYRHTGEGEIFTIPNNPAMTTVEDYNDIIEAVGSYNITHMRVDLGDEMIPLDQICPLVVDLEIHNIASDHNLDCLKSLKQLDTLNISNNNFSFGLPLNICELTWLRKLDIKQCDLREVTKTLTNHRDIQTLDVSVNDFSVEFPPAICDMTSLRELDISECHLTRLPKSLAKLKNLHTLYAIRNDFSTGLPPVLSEMTTLENLYLGECSLTDLPQRFASLKSLGTLDLSFNNFSCGLPSVISELTLLKRLHLIRCHLTELSDSLRSLERLDLLNISFNYFSVLPPVVYTLLNLHTLHVWGNMHLQTIDPDLMKLQKLQMISCDECYSLVSPPYAVCARGLSAMKKFFEDFAAGAVTDVTVVPVAVVGNLMAGKTSLIRTLKTGKRELTFRKENHPLDETTRVFKIEKFEISDSFVRFIDYGGHQVYHIAYQLMVKEKCVPMIVVNLEELNSMASETNYQEATRRLCFDWWSHLCLACPQLSTPILVLTHQDKLSDEQFEQSKDQLLASIRTLYSSYTSKEQELLHLENVSKELFQADDLFVFSSDKNAGRNIQNLKSCLAQRCKDYKVDIPLLWERMRTFINKQTEQPYILLTDIKDKFPGDNQMIILTYLHDVGEVLWFKDIPTLSNYVFHQIPKITEMISILFHHCNDDIWSRRFAEVKEFRHNNQAIGIKKYKELVQEFRVSGVMSEAIMWQLLKTETVFPAEVALEFLKAFFIIHQTRCEANTNAYIIPYFSPNYIEEAWMQDGELQLRMDILFEGLSLPKYVFQIITVQVLNFSSNPMHSIKVAKNGATIRHGERATHLIYDYDRSKVTLQISTPVKHLGPSWQRLLELTQHIISNTTKVWKASHPAIIAYCSHCLFLKKELPHQESNPSWCKLSHQKDGQSSVDMTHFTGIDTVLCSDDKSGSTRKSTVPKPLKFPCYQLTENEISKLEAYLEELRSD